MFVGKKIFPTKFSPKKVLLTLEAVQLRFLGIDHCQVL